MATTLTCAPTWELAVRARLRHFMPMLKPAKIEALPGYRIRLVYPDGVEGVIDLSADVGRGVFAPLADEAFFRTVHIGEYGQIAWSEDIEICPDSAYDEIVGKPAHAFHARS
jgi:hypothetical protein